MRLQTLRHSNSYLIQVIRNTTGFILKNYSGVAYSGRGGIVEHYVYAQPPVTVERGFEKKKEK